MRPDPRTATRLSRNFARLLKVRRGASRGCGLVPNTYFMIRLRLIALSVTCTMILASFVYHSIKISLSVAAGSLIVIVSFELLQFIISRALNSEKPPKVFLVLAAIFKFMVLGVILWWLVVKIGVHPLAFMVGLMTMIITIVIEGLLTSTRKCKSC